MSRYIVYRVPYKQVHTKRMLCWNLVNMIYTEKSFKYEEEANKKFIYDDGKTHVTRSRILINNTQHSICVYTLAHDVTRQKQSNVEIPER